MAELNTGKLTQIIGAVLDVRFSEENFLKSMTLSKFHSKTEKNLW